ncbi:helix-turn-helix domain-containing protein [Pseudomonas sp. S31]|nr:helix-turn-helix domain-containing protein [Pseudomonas sp. S31]
MRASNEQCRVEATAVPSFISHELTDVLLQASALPKWNQEYVQISEGAFSGTLQDLSLGPIQLFRESMDKAVDQHGLPWPDSFAIGVANEMYGDGFWCGDKLEPDSVLFLKPNSELKFRTPARSDIFVAVIDMQLLSEYAETVGELDAARITAISGASAASHELCSAFRANMGLLFGGVSANPQALQHDLFRRNLLSETLNIICAGLTHLSSARPHNPGQLVHRHIVEKAREFILARHTLPPTVLEVCKQLRISRRTLHYAFNKVLGISPISYLRYIRLHGARQMLLACAPGAQPIFEIAAHWGFYHSGMFGSYYKQLFGETPTATLSRRPARH